jgi:DNA-binding GntR family transcriptional regulator
MNERERAYQKIREAITYGHLKPGEKMVEMGLCQTFQIGRTPIREALRQLQMEGYIEVSVNRGAIIKKITVEELEWVYDTLSVLEAYAVELLTKKITRSEIKSLRTIQSNLAKATQKVDYKRWFDENNLFHEHLHRLSGNPVLSEEIVRLRNRIYRNRSLTLTLQGRFHAYIGEHKAILDAMIQRDSGKAATAMRTHLNNAKINVTKFLRENPWFL